jgi:3-phosphoshikimate 1-carboxyvinyltransferase
LTNRSLLLAALADGTSTIRDPLLGADDAERMLAAIQMLGATVERPDEKTLKITGVGGQWRVPPEGLTLNLNNAGTATRFLAASALLSPAPLTIDGNERMRQRPIGELLDALSDLGAGVQELGSMDCPPVRISPPEIGVPRTNLLRFEQTQSSQFISALAMTGACLPDGITLDLGPEPTSASYVNMTVRLLDQIGVRVRTSEGNRIIRVLPGLPSFSIDIEPDASGATYFWAAAALMPGATVKVEGLDGRSLQGDVGFVDLLGRMGAIVKRSESRRNKWIECRGPEGLGPTMADMANMPDAAMTLAVCCAFAGGPSIMRGVRTLRVKECDRIDALQRELGKVGAVVTADVNADADTMRITPADGSESDEPVVFDTYDDHRMAMSLALVGLRRGNVAIKDPQCVAKTYPTFWQEFARLYS